MQKVGQRFGDAHVWRHHLFRRGLAEPRGNAGAPRASDVDDAACSDGRFVATGDVKRRAAAGRAFDFGMFADLGAHRARGAGKCRCDQSRVGLAVFRAERTRGRVAVEIRVAVLQLSSIEQIERQSMLARYRRVALELVRLFVAARQLEVAGRHEFAIVADEFAQMRPYLTAAPRQRQFGLVTPLLPHAAMVDATGLASAAAALQQHHRGMTLAQMQCRRATGQAATDDGNVENHRSASPAISASGTGFTGACPRNRPTLSIGYRAASAINSAAAAPQTRP